MALIQKISACSKNCCQFIVIGDITGVYDVTTNPNGWGAPNIAHADVTAATLEMTLPNGSIISADTSDLLTAITTASTDPFTMYTFTPTGATFPDGIYTIVSDMTDGVNTYHTSITISMYCNIACCVDKMFAMLPTKMCATCDYKQFMNNALEAEALLMALKGAAGCGDTTKFNNILAMLQKICTWADCNCS